MKTIPIFLFTVITLGCAFGQSNSKGLSLIDTSKIISVTGDASLEVEPDFYKLEITISDAYCKKGETIESLLEKVKDILKSQKISPDSLKLRSMKKDDGYLMQDVEVETRTYHLNIYSKEVYERVIDLIEDLQTVQTQVLKVSNTHMDTFKEKLYDTAIRDARKKADILAKATSQQVDAPISIVEEHYDLSEPETGDFYYSGEMQLVFSLRLILQVTFKVK